MTSPSYCERLTSAEYEQQRHDVAHDALLRLLDDIIDDVTMTTTDRRRRLLQVSAHTAFSLSVSTAISPGEPRLASVY